MARVALGAGSRARARPVSHVTWDEFSHPGRWGARHLHVLAVHWGPLPGYQWVQYASGVVGAAAEAWWLLRWWRRTPAAQPDSPARPAVRLWAALVAAAVAGGVDGAATSHSLREAGFRGATHGAGLTVGVALVLAAGWHLSRRHRVTSPDAG